VISAALVVVRFLPAREAEPTRLDVPAESNRPSAATAAARREFS